MPGAHYRTMPVRTDIQDWKNSVRAATIGALPAYTRTDNTITAVANGALPAIDGVTLIAAPPDRMLLKNGASAVDNGIYRLLQVGDGANPFILERTTDANRDGEISSQTFVPVEEGAVNGADVWRITTIEPIVINTTAITWALAIAGGGGGAAPTFTTANPLLLGDVVAITTAGTVDKADATTANELERAIGCSPQAIGAGLPIPVEGPGSLVSCLFAAAPGAASNDEPVYLSAVPGEASLTPPVAAGTSVVEIGILQGADGVTTTPDVLLQLGHRIDNP